MTVNVAKNIVLWHFSNDTFLSVHKFLLHINTIKKYYKLDYLLYSSTKLTLRQLYQSFLNQYTNITLMLIMYYHFFLIVTV